MTTGSAFGPLLAVVAGCSVLLTLLAFRPTPVTALDAPLGTVFDAAAGAAPRPLVQEGGSAAHPFCEISCPDRAQRLVNLSGGWSFVLRGESKAQIVNANTLRLVCGELLVASGGSREKGLSGGSDCLAVVSSNCIVRVSRGPAFVKGDEGSTSVMTWGGEVLLCNQYGAETLSGCAYCDVRTGAMPVCFRARAEDLKPVMVDGPVMVANIAAAPRLEIPRGLVTCTVGDKLELDMVLRVEGMPGGAETRLREFPVLARIEAPGGAVVLAEGRVKCNVEEGGTAAAGVRNPAAGEPVAVKACFPYVFRSRGLHAVLLLLPFEVGDPDGCATWLGVTGSDRVEITVELPEVH